MATNRYIRTSTTKYHIDIYHGQESLLKSCLAYLLATRVFLDESAALTLMGEIANTHHSFHAYALEHWIIHLEKYAKSAHRAALPVGENIMHQLRSLLWLRKPQPNSVPDTQESLHAVATMFRHTPEVANFLSHIFSFREALPALEQGVDDPKGMFINRKGIFQTLFPGLVALTAVAMLKTLHMLRCVVHTWKQKQVADTWSDLATELARRDPSWLGEIHRSYEEHVQELLKCPNSALVDCLDPEQLQSFRRTFGSHAFYCRYKACTSSIVGFDSLETRNNHEGGHMRKYKCAVLNCFMADRGFKKPRDLKLHAQKYHPPPKIPSLNLHSPSQKPKSESDPSSLLDNLSQDVEDLRIDYVPEIEQRFTVELLHQFTTTSVCCTTAISSDERYFAVGANKCLSICSMASGELIKSFRIDSVWDEDNYIRDVEFTLDSRAVVAGLESRGINVSL